MTQTKELKEKARSPDKVQWTYKKCAFDASDMKFGGKHHAHCVCPVCHKLGGEHYSHCVCPHCQKLGGNHFLSVFRRKGPRLFKTFPPSGFLSHLTAFSVP